MYTDKEVKETRLRLLLYQEKTYYRLWDGALLLSMGLRTFYALAKDAGAIRVIHNKGLFNMRVIEEYIETHGEHEWTDGTGYRAKKHNKKGKDETNVEEKSRDRGTSGKGKKRTKKVHTIC